MKQKGYIAFYEGKRLELPLSIGDLYTAKLKAMEIFNIPKSKRGLLAIAPGYETEILNHDKETANEGK